MAASLSSAETYAVMIGINDYPDIKDADGKIRKDEKGNDINMDLSGPVNDINKYKDILVNKYGVKNENIKTYLDGAATEAGFLEGWKWAIQTAKAGDQILFVYSGHGTQLDAEDEADKKEGAIVLGDFKLVSGDFFGELAKVLVDRNINTTYVFDSCYSAEMSRGDDFSFDGKPGVRKQKAISRAVSQSMNKVPLGQLENVKTIAKQGIPTPIKGGYAFLFAGQEDQPTTDLDFKDPATPDHGLFTLMMTALVDADQSTPLDDALTAIQTVLKEKGFDQKPLFEYSSPERAKLGFLLK